MTDQLELGMDAYLPLRDVVFNALREAILRGDLKPGERLMELQLAAKLGVSRTPIREAIRMLEQEGLAVTIPRKGAMVAGMTQKEMQDVLVIRKALEVLAAVLATENIKKEDFDELKKLMHDFEVVLKSNDLKKIAQADIDFHDFIYKAAGNDKLLAMLGNLREQIYRYRIEYLKDDSRYDEIIKEHEAIFAALSSGDRSKVAAAVGLHIDNQTKAIAMIIESQNE
ncbi:MAG: GntR family transcriptional regulator [Lachnospiraceae bacterium]|nr:GntR family transcriptional regulator [Lachnospiraceae bacterium]